MGEAELNRQSNGILRLPLPRLVENSFSSSSGALRVLTDDAVHMACGTRIAFTNRQTGESSGAFARFNLSYAVGDSPVAVDANRRMLCEAFGAKAELDSLISPNQVHGSGVIVVGEIDKALDAAQAGADGVVCAKSGVPVLLCFADCVPVILVAPGGAFAVIHAGWRGALASIPGIGLNELIKATGCLSSDVNCYIGPHIGSCCYEVDSGLLQNFVEEYGSRCDAGACHLDLSAAVKESLVRAGAAPERIVDAGICTSCRTDVLYSHRAENGVTGRHGAFAFREEMTWD